MSLQPAQIFIEADAITAFPLSLGTIKTQLRLDHAEFDQLIEEVHLKAAYRWAEGYTNRSIVSRVWRWAIRDFPQNRDGRLVLPQGQAQAVTSIAYVNGGVTSTLTGPTSSSPEGTDYQEDLRGPNGGILMPPVAGDWPSVDSDVPVPVLVTFTAGWLEDDVPGEINQAVMRYIAEAIDEEAIPSKDALLNSYQINRW